MQGSRRLFCLKFRCHGNMGHPGVYLYDAVKLADPENHSRPIEPNITTMSCRQPELWQFEEFVNLPHRRHCNIFTDFFLINRLNIKFKFSHHQKAHPWLKTRLIDVSIDKIRLAVLPARRYASAGNSDRNVSVRLSVTSQYCVKTKKASVTISPDLVAPRL